MKRDIHLYGYLAEKYGKKHTLFVNSVPEAIRALKANFPDFYSNIRDGQFHILRGADLNTCKEIPESELTMLFPSEDFHIMPVVEGGKSGWTNIIIGVCLIAISIYAPGMGTVIAGKLTVGGVVASVGVSLVIGGVAMLLTSSPDANYANREDPDKRASFIFDGAQNRMEQGGPVPLVYGEMLTGSVVVAGAVDVEQMQ